MINRVLAKKTIEYVAPERISEDEFILCTTADQFQISTHFTRVPKPEDPNCDRVYYFIKRDALFDRLEGGEGYVYILECPNQPGMVKIGMTERTVQERVREINRSQGVIVPWIIHSAYPCKSPRAVEQLVHFELDSVRINSQREGFAIFPERAKEVILRVIEKYGASIEGKPQDYRETKKYWYMNR